MAKRKYTGSSDPVQWFRKAASDLDAMGIEEADNFARDGAEFMREFISTRGTKHSGKIGRIDEKRMLNAVASQSSSGATRQGRFGWLRDRAPYFLYQEGGFFNVRAQRMVEGMYAMQDAAEIAFARLNQRMKRRNRG